MQLEYSAPKRSPIRVWPWIKLVLCIVFWWLVLKTLAEAPRVPPGGQSNAAQVISMLYPR